MKTADRFWLVALVLGGLFIWLHDRAWLTAPDDALPLLAALPLLVWLAAPWTFSNQPFQFNRALLAAAGVTTVLGLVTGFNLLLSLAWTAALWSWLGRRLEAQSRARVLRLLPLAVLAFPWLSLDFPALGWWFRLSAAWSAEHLFALSGFAVHREGTQLLVAQMPFDVTPACSGLKALQAMLIAGTALCFVQTSTSRFYWLGLAGLPLVAWLANAARVVTIVVAALSAGPEFALGWFHGVGGWLVIVGMFGLTWLGLEALRRCERPTTPA